MKKYIFIATLFFAAAAGCTRHGSPTDPVDNTVDTTAVLKYSGIFMNGPYGNVSGEAKVYLQNNQLTLALENMIISNGPDLHVYLSKEVQPVNYIDLGRLQSVNGNQVYPVPGQPDFSQYKYALIHCQRYNHLFGSALMQ